MEDLGAPISYLTLEEGCACYSSDGKPLGKVEHVLADADVDVFDGIVLDTSVLPGGHRFVDAVQVASIHEGGVVLGVDADTAETLPEPRANPGGTGRRPFRSRARTRVRWRWAPTTWFLMRPATSFAGPGTGSPARSSYSAS